MLAQTLQQPIAQSGLRPFNPWRDLGQVADLVELAFGDELFPAGSEVIAEMRRWAAWGPLFWLLTLPDPSSMMGFVWTENGRVVGNLSLSLLNPAAGYWVISNVAVHPTQRRRGIARDLLEAALEQVKTQGGRAALLQVRSDNEAARQIYASYGFACYHTQVEMLRSADAPQPIAPPAGASWRKVRWQDRAAARELILAATPAAVRHYQFPPEADFRYGRGWSPDDWLGDLLAGRRTTQRIVRAGERAAALLEAQRGPRYHRLSFLVHPQERGRLEDAAVQQGLWLLRDSPQRVVLSSVSASAPEAVEALASGGFAETRRLYQMKLEL